MNITMKRSLLAGATVATIGFGLAGAAGIASADTDTPSGPSSLIEKLATKFNLDKNEVAAVFKEEREAHRAEMETKRAGRLAQAVKDGKLTQAQADHITSAQKEIHALMKQVEPGQENEATRSAIKNKIDALRTWAQENNVDLLYVGPGGHGPGGPGGHGGKFIMKLDAPAN